jgi:hypothetical protein
MKFPFVTRSRLEYEQRHTKLLQTMLTEAHDDNKELRRDLAARYDVLVKTIVGMKKEGFEPTPEIITLEEPEKLPDDIWVAINEVSAKDSREYYTLMAHAREALEAGTPHDKIIHQIVYGQEVDV